MQGDDPSDLADRAKADMPKFAAPPSYIGPDFISRQTAGGSSSRASRGQSYRELATAVVVFWAQAWPRP